jgi:type VI secretion system protein ImpL
VSIKSLLFGLFLYICLVWVAVAYWHSGVENGLYWTAIGLIALLAYLVLAQAAGWWRLRRARAAARPPDRAPAAAPPVLHEDDVALAMLLEEANMALARAPGYRAERGGSPLYNLPIYLLIGPQGSGKTSTFLNSTLEPQLLAGQVTGSGPVVPTRLCNIWLAGKAIFIELSGRTFAGEILRWKELLAVLRGGRTASFWRRLWGTRAQRAELRAVIGFCEVKEFIGASADPQRLEREARHWQERLRVIAEVFGAEFPVYQIVSKCDAVPFFPEFFRRLPETEAGQILGCTLPLNRAGVPRRGEVFAEAEAKRLNSSFRLLYHRLAARRIVHLAHEPDPAKRPAVYEFPRELKRIRSPLVQFLTDAFRPNALHPGPLLRGYYLSGTRQVEAAAMDAAVSRADSNALGLEATRLFRVAEATQMFRTEEFKSPVRRMTQRWAFVGDLFRELIPAEPARKQAPREDLRFQRLREYVLAGVAGLCTLLCLIFFASWYGNRGLLQGVQAAGESHLSYSKPPSLADLQALEKLRVEVERLRHGSGLSLHWGLYTGNNILEPARNAYFRRFRTLLLDDLNAGMVSNLASVPDAADRYDPIYRTLQTHLILSGSGCSIDPGLVSTVLQEQERSQFTDAGPEWRRSADNHIAFYASELPYGNPLPVSLDAAARDHARQYLARGRGDEAAYRAILATAEKSVAKRRRLADMAPDYAKVLTGPAEVSSAFSPDGWNFVEKASKSQKTAASDSCVTGAQTASIGDAQAIRQRYLREYIDQWSGYLAGFSVIRYSSAEDAARRLGILVDTRSPLLSLFAMTARQTAFATEAPGPLEASADRLRKKVENAIGRGDTRPEERAKPELLTAQSISSAFQPVHLVTPPASPTLVVEKNAAYVEALRQLRSAMQDLAQSNDSEQVNQTARESSRKALDAAQKLADGFSLVDAASLTATAKRLLEEPIKHAEAVIPRPKNPGTEITAGLARLAATLRPMLAKYPFQRTSSKDVTLVEFNAAFAPANGSIWAFAKTLGAAAVKDHGQWKAGDPAAKPQVAAGLLDFLNKAERITAAFYSEGGASAHLRYTLRAKPDAGRTVRLEADGQSHEWSVVFQTPFSWPSTTADEGARLRVLLTPGGSVPIASYGGTWGIFRVMDSGEFAQSDSGTILWKYAGEGRREAIEPPVQMDVLGLVPAATGVFRRGFFEGLLIPSRATQ